MRVFPAIKLQMGSWQYYSVRMKMADAAAQIHFASEVSEDRTLDEHLQRELNEGRTKPIMNYLSRRKDRFFNSLVVAALGGNPKWYPVNINTENDMNASLIADQVKDTFGVLTFDESVEAFALDGQHRLKSIQRLLANEEDGIRAPSNFEKEEISVIFVTQPESVSREEFIKSYRRVFSALNRRAKKTDDVTNVIMDEDDRFAMVTRKMVTETEFFRWTGDKDVKPKIDTEATAKNLSRGNTAFTTLVTFYYVNAELLWDSELVTSLGQKKDKMKEYIEMTPTDEELDSLFLYLSKIWDALFLVLEVLTEEPYKMRSLEEGKPNNLLFRPVGQESILAPIARQLLDHAEINKDSSTEEMQKALAPLKFIPWELEHNLWRGLFIQESPNNKPGSPKKYKMRTDADAKKVGLTVLQWLTTLHDLSEDGIDELQQKWAATLIPPGDNERERETFQELTEIRNKILAEFGD